MPTTQLKTFCYEGHPIDFHWGEENQMINATQMARAFGKQPPHFLRNKQTKAFMCELRQSANSPSGQDVVKTEIGGTSPGTWMHRKLALKFAAWLNPKFELWVFSKIEELLTTGTVKLSPISQIEAIEGALALLKKQEKKIQTLTKELQDVTIRLNKQAQSYERDDLLRESMQFQIQNIEHLVHREKFMYTISAYSNIIGKRLSKEEAQEKGYEARNKSEEMGYLTEKVYHPLYGSVNSYHLSVLNKVFHGN